MRLRAGGQGAASVCAGSGRPVPPSPWPLPSRQRVLGCVSGARRRLAPAAARRSRSEAAETHPQPDEEAQGAPTPAKASRKGRKRKSELVEFVPDAAALPEDAGVAAATGSAAAAHTPAEGPGSWADAAVSTAGEEDRRRFPYHRRLHAAASDANVEAAEAALAGMAAAGLPPGPRAYHVLLCAHLKACDTVGALEVTGRATEAGVQLLPESYAALIFAHMDQEPPNVSVAKTVYQAIAGTDTDPQLPWATLARLLAARGFAAEAVAGIRQGLAAGLALDADVAEAYVKALCDSQQSDAALVFLETLTLRHGIKPEARHINYIVAADALAGNLEDASGLIDASGQRGWGRNAATFNAYLAGLIRRLDDDSDGSVTNSFEFLRGRMVQCGVRPDKMSFKLEVEGHAKLGDARSAMGAVRSLRTAAGAGGCRLLDPGALASLLALLCERDMPVDLLQLLVYMQEDGCRLPPSALAPDAQGRTLLSRWLLGHMEAIAARAEGRATASAMLNSEVEYEMGVPLGPGRCVIDEDGAVVPVAKCTIKELRAEAQARGTADVAGMKRAELTAVVKAARARLPFNVLTARVKGGPGSIEGGSKRKVAKAGAKKKRRQRVEREYWTIDGVRGGVDRRPAPPASFETDKFLLAGAALEELDTTADEYGLASNKGMMGIDFDALLEARMLDEGTAAVMNVGDEDVAAGYATLLPGVGEDDDEADDEGAGGPGGDEQQRDQAAYDKAQRFEARSSAGIDAQRLQEGYAQLQYLESQQLDTDEANLVAGMDIAMDLVRAAEIIGGAASPDDLLLLATAAKAEASPAAAADVAARLGAALAAGAPGASAAFSEAAVAAELQALAGMCLDQGVPAAADAVLAAGEAAGLTVPEPLLTRLLAELRGAPRRAERAAGESDVLLESAGLSDDDLALGLGSPAQQQQQPAALPAPASAAAAAGAQPAIDPELLGAAGSPLGQGAAGEGEDEGEEDSEAEGELGEVIALVQNIQAYTESNEAVGKALAAAGLDAADISEALQGDMGSLLADMSWLPAALLEPGEGEGPAAAPEPSSSSSSGAAVGEGSDDQGEQQQQEQQQQQEPEAPEEQEMTLMQIARAAAAGTLSADQQELLLQSAEAAGLPMLFDEEAGQIIWPGTQAWQDWAASEPGEADADLAALAQAFAEEYADDAEAAIEAAEQLVSMQDNETDEDVQAAGEDEAAMSELLMRALQGSGMVVPDDAGAAASSDDDDAVEGSVQLPELDTEAALAAIAEQLGPDFEAMRAALNAADLDALGVASEGLQLDTPRDAATSRARFTGAGRQRAAPDS